MSTHIDIDGNTQETVPANDHEGEKAIEQYIAGDREAGINQDRLMILESTLRKLEQVGESKAYALISIIWSFSVRWIFSKIRYSDIINQLGDKKAHERIDYDALDQRIQTTEKQIGGYEDIISWAFNELIHNSYLGDNERIPSGESIVGFLIESSPNNGLTERLTDTEFLESLVATQGYKDITEAQRKLQLSNQELAKRREEQKRWILVQQQEFVQELNFLLGTRGIGEFNPSMTDSMAVLNKIADYCDKQDRRLESRALASRRPSRLAAIGGDRMILKDVMRIADEELMKLEHEFDAAREAMENGMH